MKSFLLGCEKERRRGMEEKSKHNRVGVNDSYTDLLHTN